MKKLEIRFSIISLICASIICLFGVVVLLGWFFHVSQLVQLTPLAFIQANTALSFLLSGIALLLLDKSYRQSVRILSIFIFTFGGLTLCQYLFSLNFGVDELWFKDFILTGASHPNRMAPNTALCFSLFAVALFTATYFLRSRAGNLITAILGALVFVLASVALSGFMVGLEEAFGWGKMTRMSPQTAIGFLIVSTGLICLAWKNAADVEEGFPFWSASFASVMVLTIFMGIWQSLVIGERQFIKSEIRLMHEGMVSKINFELKDRLLSLERMGSRFEDNFTEDNHRAEWEADATNYLNHYSDFSSIDWVDSDYFTQWTLFFSGRGGSRDLNLIDSAQLAPVMHLSRETRETLISPVFSNFSGQKIFSVFSPLFHEEKFLGFIRGNFIVEKFLGKIVGRDNGEIQTSAYDKGLRFFYREVDEPGDSELWMISSALDYKGLNWLVQCVPSQLFLSGMRSVKPEVVVVFGVLLAWALGAAIRSTQKAREHETNLVSINQRLAEEFAKGQQQSRALELSQKQYKILFAQVKSIIEEVSRQSGHELYASLVQNLAVSLGFKYCLMGELDPFNDGKIRTLAVWGDSRFMKDFSYYLSETPCANVVGNTLCAYPDKVGEMFPNDKILLDLGVNAYVGVPLNDSSNNPLGVLCVMHDEKLENLTNAKLILSLFADVAQSEMERQIYENELQQGREMVQVSRDIAVAANEFPDAESTLTFTLQRLCQFMGWPVGHLYLKDETSSNLRPTRYWHFNNPSRYKVLRSVTEDTIFKNGEGLPGRVMQTGRPEWVPDVYADVDFPRAKKSDKLGIRSALACPIKVRKEVVGVMEFFTPRVLEVDWEIIDVIEQVGTQVGRVLERKKSEGILREQAQVLGQIHDAVISLDSKLNVTAWNNGAERVFGFKEKEMLGNSLTYVLDDDEISLRQSLFQPAIINGRFEKEMRAVKKSGHPIFIHMSLSALCDDNCEPQSIICYALDVTEKKQAKVQLETYSFDLEKRVEQRTSELNASVEKIKESRDQTEGILKSIGEGLIVTGSSGTIVLMNFAAEKILGIKVGDALGKAADQIIQSDVLLRQMLNNDKADASGKPFDFALGEEAGPKGRKFIQGVSTSTHGAEGSLVGSVTVLRDITFERKVDNLKSQFLSTAAHELRTPLTTLQGFSEILLNKKNLPAESVERYLKYINEESLRLGKIINDFLDISRIESGREIRLDKKNCRVDNIIKRSAEMFSEAHQSSHEFVFQCPSQNIEWNVDLDKMEQVFKNLYSNAMKYSPDGGRITTSVRGVNGHTEVVIEDEGVGMSKDAVKNIFDKYYRGENTEKSVPGSGLGMTIVKYILEAHGGSVSVESEPDKGTKVVMCVPNS
jgi:PAS domain S-box-containing protein